MSTSNKSSSRTILIGVLFVAVTAFIFFFLFAGKSRLLYVVNHTPHTMTVKLANGTNRELEPNTWIAAEITVEPQDISLFQGKDSVRAVGFDPSSFTQKDGGILIYNIEAAGVVVWEEIVYSEDPEILENKEGDWRISVNEEIVFFKNADYIFEESPEEIYLTSLEGFELKSQLTFLDWKPIEVSDWLSVAVEDDPVESTMVYMEKQIELGPPDIFFIENYFDYAENNDETERANAIMSSQGWSQEGWIDISHGNDLDEWGIDFNGLDENLATITGLDSIVVDKRITKLVLSFPLKTTYHTDLKSVRGCFSLEELVRQTRDVYARVYEEEQSTSTIKPLYIKDETNGYKRNETNGTYGIWGFHLEDLSLSGFSQLKQGDTLFIIPWVYDNY